MSTRGDATCPACKGSGKTPGRYGDVCPYCKQGRMTEAQADLVRKYFARETGMTVKELVERGWLL